MNSRKLDNIVWLRLLYDPFAPETVETHELAWRDDATVGDYLTGLPDAEWMLFLNGDEVELADVSDKVLEREDQVGLVLVPQGGKDGLKSILRIVLQVAAMALVFTSLGPLAIIAINIGIGLINAFLLTPKPPTKNSGDTTQSYGIDGAKNSATEGIPFPVVYGTFRTAGNFSDCYTVNVGDDQYLYVRSVLNDGEIDSVTAIEVNEQPIANYTAVESRFNPGKLTDSVNDWFVSSITQINKSQQIDPTPLTHTTTGPIDKLRFDVAFSNGLVTVDKDSGSYSSRSVTFNIDVRQLSATTFLPTSDWTPVKLPPSQVPFVPNGTTPSGGRFMSLPDVSAVVVQGTGKAIDFQQRAYTNYYMASAPISTAPDIMYRPTGAAETAWQSAGGFNNTAHSFIFNPNNSGSLIGPTNITPMFNQDFTPNFSGPGSWDIMPVNGAKIYGITTYPSSANFNTTVSDSRTRAIRKSFETPQLAKGYYEARISRQNTTSTDQYAIDQVFLTDVAEIEVDPVALRGTANLSLKIKLTDQLNAIPQLTGLVKGCKLQQYDITGTPTVRQWTANPAWVALDILCGQERGAGVALSRIDWPKWLDLADYCDANNLQYNGIFDTAGNVGDAVQQVLRIGHALAVPFGTKYSVAIDRLRDPIAFFGPANIIADSFTVTYAGVANRSNEFEITYYDKNDRNKQKTIRYVDPKAVLFNEQSRVAQLDFAGIDNINQAKAELWRGVYANRLLIRSVQFDAWMDSIALNIGDLTLVQHDMMQWAQSGRLATGSTTTTLQLDRPVTIVAGSTYSSLTHFDALQVGTNTVYTVAGNQVVVTGSPVVATKAQRLVIGTRDYEIVRLADGPTYQTITLASAPTGVTAGQTVQLWQTDTILERPVSMSPGTYTAITLGTALPQVPDNLANWVFGAVDQVRKPYALTSINGTGIEKRTLIFTEYNAGCYATGEVDLPTPVASVNDRNVSQVTGLLFDYERLVQADRKVINARVHWGIGGIRNYSGADVYMALNGAAFRAIGSTNNVNDLFVPLNVGDHVEFKVIAYNKMGDRAPISQAPSVTGDVNVTYATLYAPAAITAIVSNFQVEGTAQITITPPTNLIGVKAYEVQYQRSIDSTWVSLGVHPNTLVAINGLQTATYNVRARSTSDTSVSPWTTASFTVAVTAGSLMADFLASNNRNASAIAAPATATSDVQSVINTDGSADLSFQFSWTGDESTLDGFEVIWQSNTT